MFFGGFYYKIYYFQGGDIKYSLLFSPVRFKRPRVLPSGGGRARLQAKISICQTILTFDISPTSQEVGITTFQIKHGQEHQDVVVHQILFTGKFQFICTIYFAQLLVFVCNFLLCNCSYCCIYYYFIIAITVANINNFHLVI